MKTRPTARILLLRALGQYTALSAPTIAPGLPLNLRTVERELQRAVEAGEATESGGRFAITAAGRAAVVAHAADQGQAPKVEAAIWSPPTIPGVVELRERLLDLPRLTSEQRVVARRLLLQLERPRVAPETLRAAEAFVARGAA